MYLVPFIRKYRLSMKPQKNFPYLSLTRKNRKMSLKLFTLHNEQWRWTSEERDWKWFLESEISMLAIPDSMLEIEQRT